MPSTDKYHPFKYAKSRPYAKRVVSAYESVTGSHPEIPTSEALQVVSDIVERGYNEALASIPYDERPANLRVAMKEVSYAFVYAVFSANGRNTFDFDEHLIRMFGMTDVADIPLSAIKSPYKVQYLYFGPQKHLRLFDGRYLVDGAYVSFDAGYLQIHLTTQAPSKGMDGNTDFIRLPDRYYFLALEWPTEQLVGDAIEEALAKELEAQKPSDEWMEAFNMTQEVAASSGIEIRSSRKETTLQFQKEIAEGAAVFKQSINLVINALCYLTAYSDEIDLQWPDDAPENLVRKAEKTGTYKEKRRAESKLLPLGFTRIRFCRLAVQNEQSHPDAKDTQQRRIHWRRGHWRQQACGPGYSEHRLRWIQPVLVNSQTDNAMIKGHIYDVVDAS